jgi:hypothetical protein
MVTIKTIAITGMVAVALPASALAASFVASAGLLNANDTLTWAQLGADGTAVPNPSVVTSVAGRTVTLSQATGHGFVSSAGSGYGPMYAPGERLYLTDDGFGNNGAPLTFVFAQDISGFGVVCDPDYYSSGFAGTISAYDAADNLLGNFAFSVSAQQQYKQVFAGVSDTSPDIRRVVIDGTSAQALPEDFAIGTVLIMADRIFANGFEP